MSTWAIESALRILLVDDDLFSRGMVALLLEQNGVEVIQADDGVQASELGMKADFDALVSDLHMPNMGGVALATAQRGQANT